MKTALLLSILIQLIAAGIAIGLTKKTKYNVSWILFSIAFTLMAGRRIIDFIWINHQEWNQIFLLAYRLLGIVISVLFIIGISFIPRIFSYLNRISLLRKEYENKILKAVVTTEEKERRRVARELHDGLGPILSTINMTSSLLLSSPSSSQKEKIIKTISEASQLAINSLREISNDLRPQQLEHHGLVSAIRYFLGNLPPTISIDFQSNCEDQRFPELIEIAYFRIFSELIHNTLKHAKASHINCRLKLNEKTLLLQYQDNGKGFILNNELNGNHQGFGLFNILSRIQSIEGSYNFHSEPNKGIDIQISTPL